MKRRTTRTRRTAAAIALGIAAAVALPSVAAAKSGDVRRAGTCNTSATSKLKLSPENGRIEVEFEVDQNRRGVRWRVVVTRNGARVFRGVRVTGGPSGSFTVRRVIGNRPGRDRVVARAVNPAGKVCRAVAVF
ncbi:MAG: hypothetical protein H6531_08870 [Actinobacteria bacterium]|nr:hypothetical protein [Thermoleophilia bacterium]MCB9011927.1 hypothetical protein [Actinomycetota bacterium]